jgi:hypothetical protein
VQAEETIIRSQYPREVRSAFAVQSGVVAAWACKPHSFEVFAWDHTSLQRRFIFFFFCPAHTESAGTLAPRSSSSCQRNQRGLTGHATATAPTPPSTGGTPDAAACWLPKLKASAAAGAGSAGVPPNTNGAASVAAAAGTAEDGGPNVNGAAGAAGAVAAAAAGNVDGAELKENAGTVVASEEALLACCERPNAFTLF